MVVIKGCVGSSCHMKGSYQVVKTFDGLIKQHELEDVVQLKASFCLGNCLNGIATMVNEKNVNNVGFSNAEQVFYDEIYPSRWPKKTRPAGKLDQITKGRYQR